MRVGAGSRSATGLSLGAAALLLLLQLSLLAVRIDAPWRYLHDDNGRRYSSYARTHLHVGLERTGGRDFFYDPHTGEFVPYGHHPPGLGLLLAGWFQVVGSDSPLAARSLAAAFHLVTSIVLLRILRHHYPALPGLVGGLALAVVPMSSYFGKLVNFEPFVLPFMVGAVLAYSAWVESGRTRPLAAVVAFVAVASLIDWPILLGLVVLAGDAARRWWRSGERRFLGFAVAALVLGLGVGLGVAAWASSAVGAHELVRATAFRARPQRGYPWWRLAGKILDCNRRYFTEPLLVAEVGVAYLLVRDAWRGTPFSRRTRLLALFGVIGLLPVVAFPTSTRFHAYWQFSLLPYAVLSLAEGLDRVGAVLTSPRRRALCVVAAAWIVVASAATLTLRYTRPSGYVARKVHEFQRYL